MRQQNARRGLWFFGIYLVLYIGFVLVNAFAPSLMERTPIAGLNVAILSGFGLILAAFLMAMVYGFICIDEDAADKREDKS
jgi:uncharacterized membrane protein (DUF485 family)